MKKIIVHSFKVALGVGALAAALTGCCMFGKGKCCDKCCKTPCECCCKEKANTGGSNPTAPLGTARGMH